MALLYPKIFQINSLLVCLLPLAQFLLVWADLASLGTFISV